MVAMEYGELRSYCRALVSDLGVSPPLDPVVLCARLAEVRGRPIKLFPKKISVAAAVGVLLAADGRDLITYQSATTLPHQGHIIYHEVMHLARGHLTGGAALTCGVLQGSGEESESDPSSRRSVYEDWQEWEAETGATILSEWSHWDLRVSPSASRSSRARRLYASLDDPMWD